MAMIQTMTLFSNNLLIDTQYFHSIETLEYYIKCSENNNHSNTKQDNQSITVEPSRGRSL